MNFQSRLRSWGLVIQALIYILLGVNHFWHTAFYVSIMPTHYLHPRALVLISGAAEISGGAGLLIEKTRWLAAWGLVLLLLIYFDVHFFMATHTGRFLSVPVWVIYGRIPLQFVLIAWAWKYTRRRSMLKPEVA